MAHWGKRRTEKEPSIFPFTCDIEFDGIVQLSDHGRLVADILKFLLYQRQQIPMQYDDLCKTKLVASEQQGASPRKTGVKKDGYDLEERKKIKLVSLLDSLFVLLDSLFKVSHSITQILILFGGTIVSPKESFLISLPIGVYDGNILSPKMAKCCLFKQLVTSECWSHLPEINPTKMHILLRASSVEDLSALDLRPKLAFNPHGKERRINLDFYCVCPLTSSELSRLDTDFNISGVEPLETSVINLIDESNPSKINVKKDSSSLVRGRHNSGNDNSDTAHRRRQNSCNDSNSTTIRGRHNSCHGKYEINYDDLIWYQLPIVIEGFCHKH